MQDKKIQCTVLQSEPDRQGDIPIPIEKMGTLTHCEVGSCRNNCSATAMHCTSVLKELSKMACKA